MLEMDGFESVSWLKRYHPDISILVICMFESESVILRMLQLGVKGCLCKDIEVEDMHCALEAITNKGFYYSDFVSSEMAKNIQDQFSKSEVTQTSASRLSENEREFLKMACMEFTYQQISDKMNLSPKTIDGYREGLFHRFNVKSRVCLAMYAVKNGIVQIP